MRHLLLVILVSVWQLGIATQVYSQSTDEIARSAQGRRALNYLKASAAETIEEQIKTCEIPAPPFKEEVRANYYRQRFTELGLKNVRIDEEGNVIGERPGAASTPSLVLSAHLDTVFPEETNVKVTRQGAVLKGPGICDDCRGLAVILAVARALNEAQIETKGTIVFVATVGEEGPGNLRGVRHLFQKELKGKITHFISVDGHALEISHNAVGSYRYRATFRGPGGHSYLDFGLPSPIHALGRAIEKISRFDVPKQPKTTFTVGLIEGGTSVNAIAHTAWMDVDMRSESAAELVKLNSKFQEAVQAALNEENSFWPGGKQLVVELKLIGERPTGEQSVDAPIVKAALAADAALGIKTKLEALSTDSNIPISMGIPAVTIGGGGEGHSLHSLEEYFDRTDSHLGAQRALLITLAIVGVR